MPGPLRISAKIEIPEDELTWRFSRSSGAGGQAVNKASTRAELSFDLATSPSLSNTLRERALQRLANKLVDGTLTIVASERRSQYQNRIAAEERLVELLKMAIAPPPKPRRPTRPTLSSKRERVDDKRRRGDIKRGRARPDASD